MRRVVTLHGRQTLQIKAEYTSDVFILDSKPKGLLISNEINYCNSTISPRLVNEKIIIMNYMSKSLSESDEPSPPGAAAFPRPTGRCV